MLKLNKMLLFKHELRKVDNEIRSGWQPLVAILMKGIRISDEVSIYNETILC